MIHFREWVQHKAVLGLITLVRARCGFYTWRGSHTQLWRGSSVDVPRRAYSKSDVRGAWNALIETVSRGDMDSPCHHDMAGVRINIS